MAHAYVTPAVLESLEYKEITVDSQRFKSIFYIAVTFHCLKAFLFDHVFNNFELKVTESLVIEPYKPLFNKTKSPTPP